MIKFAWCAGHGGYVNKPKKIYATSGKRTPDGQPEWEFNDVVGRAFDAEINKYEGVVTKRFDDPTGKTDVPLITRTNNANAWGADYYFSFHHNAKVGDKFYSDVTGIETFVQNLDNGKAHKLANALHPEMVKAYGLKDRGVKSQNLHITRETKCPAILFEGGFMDSTIDIVQMRKNDVLVAAGTNVAKRLASYLGLKLKASQVVEVKPSEQKKEEDELKFTSPTLKAQYESRTKSSATAKLLDQAAIDVLHYQSKLKDGKLSDGDLSAIAIELAVALVKEYNKKK